MLGPDIYDAEQDAMEQTPNIKAPYLMPSQAQKHIVHNEALRVLDAVVQLVVKSRESTEAPGAADGDRFIVAAPATGPWAGHENDVSARQDGAWSFHRPLAGWTAWSEDEEALLVFDGTQWTKYVPGLSDVNPVALAGINTTADTVNRLAVKSQAVLLSHDDTVPGNGDVRVKLNKAGGADTATLLLQDNWSGRAEIGLAGDDDLHVKVSPDGSAWHEAIVIDRSSGRAAFPGGGVREQLAADRAYYVRTDGGDANDGLADSAGRAFATIQKAVDTVATLDLGAWSVIVHVGPGTYAESVTLKSFLGSGTVTIEGDPVAPANVTIQSVHAAGELTGSVAQSHGDCLFMDGVAGYYVLDGLTLRGTDRCIYAANHSKCMYRNIRFDGTSRHVQVQTGAIVQCAEYSTSAVAATSFAYHIMANMGGQWTGYGSSLAFPAVSATMNTFAYAQRLSIINLAGTSFTNKASMTGKRFLTQSNAVINVNGAAADHLPGTVAGEQQTGGIYL